jgi:ubiquinone/menaquinone biosynthesis C-methylase UbiE
MEPMVTGPLDIVRLAAGTLAAARVLDIGCGEGRLAAELARQGATVEGIDPNPEAIRKARASVPGATFTEATAEALPFPDASFDVAVIFNALHHVPEPAMEQALREAARCLRLDGRLVVIEPDVSGSFFAVVKLVDDETDVRRKARAVLEQAVLAGLFTRVATHEFIRHDTFSDVDAMMARIVAVDPERAATVLARRQQLAEAFARAGKLRKGVYTFEQPHWAAILEVMR